MFDFLSKTKAKTYPAQIVATKIPASKLTPLMVCEAFKAPVLLESAFLKTGKGRFSILVLQKAFCLIKENMNQKNAKQKNGDYFLLCEDKKIPLKTLKKIGNTTISKDSKFLDFLDAFRNLAPRLDLLGENLKAELSTLPIPLGGVGYLGFEFFSEIEEITFSKPKLYDCYDNAFIFGSDFIIFDHFYESLYAISISYENEQTYCDVKKRNQAILNQLKSLKPSTKKPQKITSTPLCDGKKAQYTKMVKILKKEIYKGNLLQCVPSRSFQIKSNLPPLLAYSNLRTANPSPYMYFYDFGHFHIIGASPEALIKVETPPNSTLSTLTLRPIAGTRKRGKTQVQDLRLEEELKNSEKENAEHLMLLDLGRNDVGKVAKSGSVQVTQQCVIEKYARVMHLVSEVKGIMDLKSHSKQEALLAAFPAGTISGAPKIQAIKTIESLEPHARGIYSGAVGYFDRENDMNFAIAIRTAVFQKGVYYLQAGGGIVYDSLEEEEYLETQNKMQSLIDAIMGEEIQKGRVQ